MDVLNRFYPEPPIPLKHKDAYSLLVSVLLSAQCTDERVNKVSPVLFKLADTPDKMAKIDIGIIREIIKPCGLSVKKAKAISELSGILVEKFNSQVPKDMALLEELPGVGHKTASVVMSQIFHQPTFPVDTHIHRLAYRWSISSGKNVIQTEKDCKRIFPEEAWNILHLQLIYFGREYCPARGHNKLTCPICKVIGRKSIK